MRLKRCLLLVYALLMVTSTAYAADTAAISWTLDDGVLTVTTVGEDSVLTSPEDQPWADVRDEITEVRFSNVDQMHIENTQYWFTGCMNLVRVEIPYTAKIIGTETFAGCPSLTEILFYYYDEDDFEIVPGAFHSDTHVDTMIYLVSDQTVAMSKIQDYAWDTENRHVSFYDVYTLDLLNVQLYPTGTLVTKRFKYATSGHYTAVQASNVNDYGDGTYEVYSTNFILSPNVNGEAATVREGIWMVTYDGTPGTAFRYVTADPCSIVYIAGPNCKIYFETERVYDDFMGYYTMYILVLENIYTTSLTPATSTLTVNPNGGTWNSSTAAQSFTQNSGTTLSVSNPTRAGYTFTGWTRANTYGSFDGSTYTFGSIAGVTDTLTATWTINSSTLTINPNGGAWNSSASSQSFRQNYGTTKTIANPTITNYTATFNSNGGSSVASKTTNRAFSSWSASGNAGTLSGTTFTFGATANGTGTLTANYSGNYVITLPAAPSKTGYTFQGWYNAASGGSKIGDANASVTLSSDVTYHAQWKANTSTLVINPRSGEWQGSSVEYEWVGSYGETITIPIPTRTGYTFREWFPTHHANGAWQDGSGLGYGTLSGVTGVVQYTFGPTQWGYDAIIATWNQNTYTVTWDAQGGSGSSSTSQVYDAWLSVPSDPTKPNAYFNGWWTDPIDGTKVTSSDIYQTASNTTYYAHWIQAFSVTVPTTLPLAVDPSGNVAASDVQIANSSTGDVIVSSVTLSALNGWQLVPYTTDMSTVKVGSKCVGFKLNEYESSQSTFYPNWLVGEGSSITVNCSAVLPAIPTTRIDEAILSIVFVIDWANP